MKLLNIGYGNSLNEDRVVAVVSADSAPSRRMIAAAKERGLAVDATCGKKTKAVFVMDSGHIVMSAKDIDSIYAKEALREKGQENG